MAADEINLSGGVTAIRRSGRSISMRVMPDGSIKLNVPAMVSRRRLEKFLDSKKLWINRRQKELIDLYDFSGGRSLAPDLTISFKEASAVKSVKHARGIIVYKPAGTSNWEAYLAARKHVKDSLNPRAQQLLIPKLQSLAAVHGFKYSSASVKFMRSRWGSCTSDGRITLNSQLLRLPNELIDYVLLHELAHLKAANHSPKFYSVLEKMAPDAKAKRRKLRRFQLLY